MDTNCRPRKLVEAVSTPMFAIEYDQSINQSLRRPVSFEKIENVGVRAQLTAPDQLKVGIAIVFSSLLCYFLSGDSSFYFSLVF